MRVATLNIFAISAAFSISFSDPVAGQVWEFEYLEADNPQQISACVANVSHQNLYLSVRIYDDLLDIFVFDSTVQLPPGEVIGSVRFTFTNHTFDIPASSTSPDFGGDQVSSFFLNPLPNDYENLLQSLRFGSQFDLEYPDGTRYAIGLSGSNEAIEQAFECWGERETGSFQRNPFDDGSPEGRNPFN